MTTFINVEKSLPRAEKYTKKLFKGSPYFSETVIAKTKNRKQYKAYYGVELKKFFKYSTAGELKDVTHWKPINKS